MKLPEVMSSLLGRSKQRVGWFAICANAQGVYFAHVKLGGERPQVLMCAFHPVDNLTPAVLEKLRKEARIGDFQFTTLLAPGDYQMLLLDAPNVHADEMKAAIRWRIKDSLNYLVDDATIDVLKIPASKAMGERPQSLYAVAAPNNTIKKIESMFERARIDLNVIDIPEMAQRNIAALYEEPEHALGLLAVDDGGSLLTFTCDGELYLARRIDVTLEHLRATDEDMRQQHLERLEVELQRSMDYFGRQYSHIPVSRLLVSAPLDLGLPAMLAPAQEVPVESLELAHALDISAVPELEDSEFAVRALHSLGAALRYERRVL